MSGNEEPETKEIGYNSNELSQIKKALFTDTLSINQELDPIFINDTTYLYMKVQGWNDNIVFSQNAINERYETVREDLHDAEADRIYEKFVAGVMKGKKLSFDNMVLLQLADAISPLYLSSEADKKDSFMGSIFGDKKETPEFKMNAEQLDKLQDSRLFTIDNEDWLVKDLTEYLQIHPFVFRKKNFPKREFLLQLRFAIVDLLQDKYLAEEGYRQGLQNDSKVVQYENQFRDANMGLLGKYKYLESYDIEGKDGIQLVTEFMNPYIEELQTKYSDEIEIDVELFNKIKLTSIDMLATQKNVPFPIVVPSFPQLTTSPRLDYGKKLK